MAAVHPAGPDPTITSLCASSFLPIRRPDSPPQPTPPPRPSLWRSIHSYARRAGKVRWTCPLLQFVLLKQILAPQRHERRPQQIVAADTAPVLRRVLAHRRDIVKTHGVDHKLLRP